MRAGCAPVETTGTYNIGTGQHTTLTEVHGLMSAALDGSALPSVAEDRSYVLNAISLKATKAEKELEWKPTLDLAQGIRRTIRWLCATLEPSPLWSVRVLASMFRKRTAPTVEPGASELQSFASRDLRRHRLCPSQLHSRQHGRVIAARRRDGGQQFVILLPGVGSQRLAGEHHTRRTGRRWNELGSHRRRGSVDVRIACDAIDAQVVQDCTRKVSRRSEFRVGMQRRGSEGSQGCAVIRVSREEQEAVTHILRLFEQVKGRARARRGVPRPGEPADD